VALWTNRYNGPGNGDDRASALAVDTNGNVFVTGYSYGSSTGYDYATVAYSNAGAPLWTNRYSGQGNGEDRATAIAVAPNGNVVVTGRATNSTTGLDCVTVAYSPAGAPLWTNLYNDASDGNDYGAAIAIDKSGKVCVAGSCLRGHSIYGDMYDYLALAYASEGAPLWTNRYMGIGDDNSGNAITVDCAGNAVVTGESIADPMRQYSYVYATVAYAGSGTPLWTNRASEKGIGTALGADNNGNVIVTGDSFLTLQYLSALRAPYLGFRMENHELVLTWTNPGFSLQAAAQPRAAFTNIPGAAEAWTNPSSSGQQYFRLKSN
jgi:hypothetical protein